jgi:type I restriction enzyme R subunit/putative DNA methylase
MDYLPIRGFYKCLDMPVPPRTKREHLRQLVEGKNAAFRPLTDEEKALGFLGWHERGYLPHCDYPGLVQLITFRLADSMPAQRRGEWEQLLAIEDVREKRAKLEEYLDRGIGQCHLRDPRIAKLTEDALLHFNGHRHELLAWCVMPNHVHVLVQIWQTPLGKTVQGWKRFVATRAETILMERRPPTRHDAINGNAPARRAALQSLRWQREYWDTFMRDEAQERIAIRYIESNPLKAKLCRTPEDRAFSSAKFRDKFHRLLIPAGAPVSDPA